MNNPLEIRLAFFLGAVSALAPAAVVRVDGDRPLAPADVVLHDVDCTAAVHVIVCLSPDHLDDSDWSRGYTPEWDRISKALDEAAKLALGACDDGGIEEDGSGETWSYTLRLGDAQ